MMLTRILLTALLLLLPVSSWAAIAFVSVTNSAMTQSVSSLTTSVVVPAGTDRIMLACVQQSNSSELVIPTVSGVTFNTTETFTQAKTTLRSNPTDNPAWRADIWYLVAPTETTANAVVNFSSALNNRVVAASFALFTGVSQSSPLDSVAGSGGTASPASTILTTLAADAWIMDCLVGQADGGFTVGSGQTMRTDRTGGFSVEGLAVSTVDGKATPGAETMDWTHTAGQNWAHSVMSLVPSGGAEAAPAVLGQASVSWVNGSDAQSGVVNTTIKRCTGTGCNAGVIGAPTIGTVAYPGTSFVDTTVAVNTTYGYSAFHTNGAGFPSISHATVYVTTSATPPDAPPTITSAVTDATGSTLTYGVTPTQIRVITFTSLGVVSSVIHEMTDFPAGRFTQTWLDGLQGVCFRPIDAAGIENTVPADYQCDTLTGIVGVIDQTPPVLSGCQPTTDLPAGTTSWTFSCEVDKPATGKYDTTDAAYATLANSMVLNALTLSATVSGLTNGSTTTLYLRPQMTDIDGNEFPALTSTVVTVTVASSTADTTPPATVTGLACTLLGNAASCTWNAAADAVSYQMYQADGACATYAPSGTSATTTILQPSLNFGTVYCWKVKALDVVSNFSADFSNMETLTTLDQPDIEDPSDLQGLQVEVFTNSVRASWITGTDNIGPVSVNLEYCQAEVGQTDCANFNVTIAKIGQSFLTLNLSPTTWYCFRGKNGDGAGNVSLNYSETVCAQTATTGLGRPRVELTPGTERPVASTRPAASTRTQRQ